MADLDQLLRRGVISERAAQRMMTHMPEQPNPAQPVLDAVGRFARGGISGVIGHHDPLGDALQSEGANAALGVMGPIKGANLGSMSRRVPLSLVETKSPIQAIEAGKDARNFRMMRGETDIGGISIDPRFPDQPYVNLIENYEGGGAGSLGQSAMRELLAAIRGEFPEARAIAGHRISGGREAAGKTKVVSVPMPGSQYVVPPEEITVRQHGTNTYQGKSYFLASDKRGTLPGDYILAESEADALAQARATKYRRFYEEK